MVKADGLAAGKGVIVAMTLAEAEDAVRDMLSGNAFGDAGARAYTQLPRSHPARYTAHLSTSCGTAFFLAADK